VSVVLGAGVTALAMVAGGGVSAFVLLFAGAVVGASLHAPNASASARTLTVRVVDICFSLLQ